MMDSTSLTNLWWKKDKNGIEFLAGNLNARTKVMVLPNIDKKSKRDPDYFLHLEPQKVEDDAADPKMPDKIKKKISGLIIVFIDITDELNMEKTMEEFGKLAGVGTLSAGLAHEIGNPMGIILNKVSVPVAIAGARNHLKFLPFFLLPYYYDFPDDFMEKFTKFLLFFSFLQCFP